MPTDRPSCGCCADTPTTITITLTVEQAHALAHVDVSRLRLTAPLATAIETVGAGVNQWAQARDICLVQEGWAAPNPGTALLMHSGEPGDPMADRP